MVFPNKEEPNLGIFIKKRMFTLAKHCDLKIIAPIPYFPFLKYIKKKYVYHRIPDKEIQEGIEVVHPKFFYFPGLFKFLDGIFLFFSLIYTILKLKKKFDFDLIDSHFAYPDGFAAVLIAKILRKPVAITVRGVDVIRLPKYFLRKLMITYALNQATRIICVSNSLKLKTLELGIPENKIVVIPNGVDISQFKPIDKKTAKTKMNLPLDKYIILSVGGLVERKGYHRVVRVLPNLLKKMPNILYIIIGGPCREGNFGPQLRKLISELALEKYIMLAGNRPHSEIVDWMNAADVFCLMTCNEGWANVFFEALASATPVVTTKIGGNSEVIKGNEFGILIDLDHNGQLEDALIKAYNTTWDKEKMIEYAASNTWENVAKKVVNEFEQILEKK